jgi:predicted DNA-binding transcriptional regulator YafY
MLSQYPYTAVEETEVRDALERAAEGHERVVLYYTKPGAHREARSFEPFDLRESAEGVEYVHGWDYERGAERNFRLERTDAVTRDPMFGDAVNLAPPSAY